MTMLDRMRRHKNWLKWSLILVCLAFVVFYIPDFVRDPAAGLAAGDTVATVDGREISGADFQRMYQAQLGAYRQAYGGISDQVLRQLGIDRQVLQQLIDEQAAVAEAERLSVRVTDEEVRHRILTLPGLQENGTFIGEARYLQLLAAQRPPVTAAEFEETLRQALAVDKLRAIVTGWLSMSDDEVEAEFRRRNDRVRLALAVAPLDTYRPSVTASEAEIAGYFEENAEEFRVPEKRQIRYALIDTESIRTALVVPDADIERFYNDNFEQFSTPEEVRASHILIRTEGREEAEARAEAEKLLEEARGGADFAELAREHSDDAGSAEGGGDLDFFRRGQMVPAFEEAAFALETGAVSDLVRSDFGFHIITVTDRRPGTTSSLESVREQIVDQLSEQRAQAEAADRAEQLAAEATDPAAFEAAAAARGLTIEQSDFFASDEPPAGIGPAPALAARVFAMAEQEMSGVVPTPRGPVVATLVGREESYLPAIDEVREQVRAAVVTRKASELARQRLEAVLPRLRTAPDFEAAAKASGLTTDVTEPISRDAAVGQVGPASGVLEVAFSLEAGEVSQPVETESGPALVKVLEKQETTAEQLAEARDRFREELLAERRSRLFSAYMTRAKERMQIRVYYEAVERFVG